MIEQSKYIDKGGTGLIMVGFRKLIIDEIKANNILLFRLAESVSNIIVHEKVHDEIEKKEFSYIKFRSLT